MAKEGFVHGDVDPVCALPACEGGSTTSTTAPAMTATTATAAPPPGSTTAAPTSSPATTTAPGCVPAGYRCSTLRTKGYHNGPNLEKQTGNYNAKQCATACATTAGCLYWVVKPDATCVLKTAKRRFVEGTGYTHGDVDPVCALPECGGDTTTPGTTEPGTTTTPGSCELCPGGGLASYSIPLRGYTYNSDAFLVQYKGDAAPKMSAACADLCDTHGSCLSFQWSRDTHACQLFDMRDPGASSMANDWQRKYALYRRLPCGACREASTTTGTGSTTTGPTQSTTQHKRCVDDTSVNCQLVVIFGTCLNYACECPMACGYCSTTTQATTTMSCTLKPAPDIAILIDSSLSMAGRGWLLELQFVSKLAEKLHNLVGLGAADDETRMALVKFSNTAVISFDYDTLSDPRAISEHLIENVAFMGADEGEGMTYAGAALEHLRTKLNGAPGTHGYRGKSPVAIIVTDGNPNDAVAKLVSNTEKIIAQGDYGTEVYAVMIGQQLDAGALQEMAGVGANVLTPASFLELVDDDFVTALARKAACVSGTDSWYGTPTGPEGNWGCGATCQPTKSTRRGQRTTSGQGTGASSFSTAGLGDDPLTNCPGR